MSNQVKPQSGNRRFSVEEKRKYFHDRINDVRLTAGQRRYAEMRLNELGGNDPTPPKRAVNSSCRSPAFLEAKAQLDESIAFHEKNRGKFGLDGFNPYSSGYVMGAQTYDLYREAATIWGNTNPDVKDLQKNLKIIQDQNSKLSKCELLPEDKDPLGIKNLEVIEARGFMKGLSDAAKARKGIKLK